MPVVRPTLAAIHARLGRAARCAALAAALFAALASFAHADTLRLKDGRVLEGEVVREGEGYIYFRYKIAGIEQTTVFLTSQIEQLEREGANPAATPDKPAPPAPKPTQTEAKARPAMNSASALRIAFISLGDPPRDMVGPYINAGALRESIKRLEDAKPDVVVLRINSGGGALSEESKLVRVIQQDLKPKYRVAGWIESAISAAAMTAINLEELYFMKKGNLGGAVAFRMTGPNQAEAATGAALEVILAEGEQYAKNGRHDPLLVRAMQTPTDLSCDIDENGVVHWRNDLNGQHIVSTAEGNRILTLNSIDAMQYGLASGVADTKDELAKLLGASEWVEVGESADEYQQDFRKNVAEAEVAVASLWQRLELSLKAGQFASAEQYLGQIRGWVRRAPSLEEYGAGGLPPLTDEFFRDVRRDIDRARRNARR